ncbi:IS1634 family transposase [Candidatus Woesearchaeota archaeon]|nr:IS1634 family transposase [Candidatus Woesearchaeota archaeon]
MNKHKTKGGTLGEISKVLISELSVEPISILQAVEQSCQNGMIESSGKKGNMLQASYRALAIIGQNADEIYAQIFEQVKKIYHPDLGAAYNDYTSTFFSGNSCSLAKHGHSKDHRPDKPQITIGLTTNAAEPVVPIMSSVAEGNIHDSKHFEEDFEKLKQRVPEGALLVFDKGVDSENNRKMIKDAKMHFLTACKIHEPMKAEMRKHTGKLHPVLKHGSGEQVKAFSWEEDNNYYTLYLDERRQKSDNLKRQAKIAKAESYWNELDEIRRKKGTKAFHRKLKLKRKKSFALQDYVIQHSVILQQRLAPKKDMLAKLREDEDLDGMFVLVTSKKMSEKKKLKIYRKKALIEKMFSDIKSALKLHPLRVWNDDRVRGLVLLKVICLMLLSLLQMEQQELRNIAKSTIVLMLKSLTVVVQISKTGSKTLLGYSYSDKILAKIFSLKS